MAHEDLRTIRIEKQLASVLRALRASVSESEALADQSLCDDLHVHLRGLEAIHVELVTHGRRYKSPPATVRI